MEDCVHWFLAPCAAGVVAAAAAADGVAAAAAADGVAAAAVGGRYTVIHIVALSSSPNYFTITIVHRLEETETFFNVSSYDVVWIKF